MTGSILTLNAGSSSLKFSLFDLVSLDATIRGEIDDLDAAPHLVARDRTGRMLTDKKYGEGSVPAFADLLIDLLAFIDTHLGPDGLIAVGHRVVYGGPDHVSPALIDPVVLAALEALVFLDPLHMPSNLEPIRLLAAARPKLPQVTCFDTGFHATLPLLARQFALPRAVTAAGVRRYGIHGLSYEYIVSRMRTELPVLVGGRVIAAHLGSGASLCGLNNGISVATTGGFSVLEGLMMATRCGNLDPGVIFYLGRMGHSPAAIEDMLYHRAGLLGVSGISGDIRVLLASDAPAAREAIDLFTYRISLEVGSLTSALGGLDGLVFTAGIGTHAPLVRAAICRRLEWLGVRLDASANLAGAGRISLPDSAIDVRVIATDEEVVIARHVKALLHPDVV